MHLNLPNKHKTAINQPAIIVLLNSAIMDSQTDVVKTQHARARQSQLAAQQLVEEWEQQAVTPSAAWERGLDL